MLTHWSQLVPNMSTDIRGTLEEVDCGSRPSLPSVSSYALRFDDSCAVFVSCMFCEAMALPLVSVSVSLRYDDSCAVCVSCMFCEAMALPLVSVSVSLPSKHAGSDSHPVRISSEVFVRSGPDDSCTPACFRIGSVWSKPHSQHRFPAPSSEVGCRKPVLGVWVKP